ncbi:hypothetical protein V8E36_002349 [Tilletia maclaganii]
MRFTLILATLVKTIMTFAYCRGRPVYLSSNLRSPEPHPGSGTLCSPRKTDALASICTHKAITAQVPFLTWMRTS